MKNKKLSNLKLRTKRIGAIIAASILLSLIIVGGVIAVNRSISSTSDNIETFIQCSNGNYYSFTESNIRTAIWSQNSSGGGLVDLPEGTATITSSIQLTNGTTLRGKGITTILQRSGNWNDDIIRNIHTTSYVDHNITVSDLYIDDAPTGTTFPCGLCIYRANNILIERVYVNGSEAHGIELFGCENGTVRDCTVANAQDDAFQSDSIVARPAKHQLWENCVAYKPGQMGIKLENQGHTDITIKGCTIISPTTNGIGGISTTGGYKDIIIEGNWIYDTTLQSISFKDLKSGKIVNNWIIEPQHQGITIDGNTYNTDPCYGFSIEGNHIIDGANYGIYLLECKHFQVINNYIEDCTTNMIAIWQSTNGTIANNIINASATTGIKLHDGGTNGSNDNVISGNILNGLTTGISEENTGNYNIITSNNARGCTTNISTVGANTITDNNL